MNGIPELSVMKTFAPIVLPAKRAGIVHEKVFVGPATSVYCCDVRIVFVMLFDIM